MKHRARRALGAVTGAVVVVVAGTLLLAAAPARAAEPECPNEARRSEQGVPGRALPDCRAYELVSPSGPEPWVLTNKGPANVYKGAQKTDGVINGAVASLDGNRFAFYSKFGSPPGSASAGPYYLSTRKSSGWSTQDVIPPQSTEGSVLCNPYMAYYTPDLSKGVLADGIGQLNEKYKDEYGTSDCGGHDEPLLVPGEPQLVQNLFLRDSETGSYQLLDLNQPELTPRNAWFQGGSSDLSHVVFTSAAPLTPEAPTPPTYSAGFYSSGEDLYENSGGVIRLVTVLPDGTPAWGLLPNAVEGPVNGTSAFTHAVSADGERVLFYAGGELFPREKYVGGNLYMRENAAQQQSPIAAGACTEPAKACTVQVDVKQGGSGSSGGGIFQWASADGAKVFFTDESKLTADSTATSGKPDLYEYDVEAPEGERLTDLTVNAAEPADVLGLSGISEDGAFVYFVADGVLTGTEENSQHAEAEAGQPNLYLRHAGATTFIATLLPGEDNDVCDWQSSVPRGAEVSHCLTARVSPNGHFLAFNSLKELTGYDNTPVDPTESTGCKGNGEVPKPCQEIFLYDAAHNELSCASCDPTGAPPIFAASIHRPVKNAGWMESPLYLQSQVSENGQVFFDTQNRLLPGDVNGHTPDVYEYQGGNLHLISSGATGNASYFYGASASGNDVFFLTDQVLVGSDGDATNSLYDARVGGGFPEPPPPVVCETEEACHLQHPEPPPTSTSGTSHFEGPGNPHETKCRKGFVRRHGRCVKVRRHHHKRSHRRANLNRGGQK